MVYNSIQKLLKLKKQYALLQSVNSESISVDGCVPSKYEVAREKEEHEFFILPEINGNNILGRNWFTQFDILKYYDLGYMRVGKSYIKFKEDINSSSIARISK